MTYIAIDDLETSARSLDEIVESETLKPIGFCSNLVSRQIGLPEPCGTKILSNDIEALDMPGDTFICGPCIDSLINRQPSVEHQDVDKSAASRNVRRRHRVDVQEGYEL